MDKLADNRLELEIEMKSKEATESMSKLVDKFSEFTDVVSDAKNANSDTFDKLSSEMEKLSGSIDKLSQRADKSFGQMGKSYSRTGKTMEKTSKGIVRSLTSVTAKLYAIVKGAKWLKEGIKSAMDFRETIHLFSMVFSRLGDEAGAEFQKGFEERINKFQTKMASLGLDPNDLMRYQSVFAQMSKSMGVASETAYDISESFTSLGADLSALYNVPVEEMMVKLQSGLAGQIRPLRQLGIDISKTTLMEEARTRGIAKSVEQMTASEKVQLRYLAIMRQTQIAMGDMASTIDRPTNQLRIMSAQWVIAARSVGEVFLPVVQRLIPVLTAVAMIITRVSRAIAGLFGIKQAKPKITPGLGGGMSFAPPEPISPGGGKGKGTGVDWDKEAKGVDKVKKKVKELKGDLLGFDEINILKEPPEPLDPSKGPKGPKGGGLGGGGTGGLGGGFDLSDEIAKMNAEYQKMLDEIMAKTESQAEKIANSIMNYMQQIRLIPALKEIVGLIGDIGRSWKTAWDSDGPQILDLTTQILTNMFGTVEKIAISFRKAWNENDRGNNIMHNINQAIIHVLSVAEKLTGVFQRVWGEYGDDLARAFVSTLEMASRVLKDIGWAFEWVWDNGGEYLFEQLSRLGMLVGELALFILEEFVLPFVGWFAVTMSPAVGFVTEALGKFLEKFNDLIEWLLGDGRPVLDTIVTILGSMASAFLLGKVATKLFDGTVGKAIKTVDRIKKGIDLFSKVLLFLQTPTGLVVVALGAIIAIGVTLYKNWDKISEKARALGKAISDAWNNIWGKTKDIFGNISKNITDRMESARKNAREKANNIKSSLSTAWNNSLSNTREKFSSIAGAVGRGMRNAKNKIANSGIGRAWNRIWNLKLPKIKLPHFRISGKFSLKPPSVPRFSVDWYDKGGVFTGPQVIGVGEKRPEFVGALDDLRDIVREESGGGGDLTVVVKLGDDTVREAVVSDMNRQSIVDGETVVEI